MNNKIYIFLTIVLCLFAFSFIFGCGKYVTQYSAPVIISRYPPIGAALMGSAEVLRVKFSKHMNENNWISEEVASKIYAAADSNATPEIFPELTVEAIWSEDNTKLSVYNIFFSGSAANYVVHLVSSKEAFSDVNGLFLPENTTLWSYTLEVP